MKPKISLLAMVLAGALPFAALAAEPGQYIDDAAITTKIKSAFVQDKQISALDVKVSTEHGVVKLSGYVDNKAAIARAAEVASAVAGVKSVKNDVRLKMD